jgi:hypothetical protein
MTDDELAAIDGRLSVGIDPGRRDLLHMIGDINLDAVRLILTCSNKQHVHERGRLRHMQRSAEKRRLLLLQTLKLSF